MRSPCITMKSNPCSPQLEKAHAHQQSPITAYKNTLPSSDLLGLSSEHLHCAWVLGRSVASCTVHQKVLRGWNFCLAVSS